MIIRRAKNDDKEILWNIQTRAIRCLGVTHYNSEQVKAWAGDITPEDSYNKSMERFDQSIEHNIVIVAEEINEKVVGFIILELQTGEVSSVYVDPDFARQGIGRQLIETLEEEALHLNITKLHIRAALNAVPFYKRMKYTAEEEIIHQFRSGIEMPCVIMTKDLANQ